MNKKEEIQHVLLTTYLSVAGGLNNVQRTEIRKAGKLSEGYVKFFYIKTSWQGRKSSKSIRQKK
jgi:hypothetical protein